MKAVSVCGAWWIRSPSSDAVSMRRRLYDGIDGAVGMTSRVIIVAIAGAAAAAAALSAPDTGRNATVGNDRAINDTSARLLKQGREVFRFETFGDEAWWTDTIQLHRAIEGENHGGVGGGVSPATALSVGLKVDIDAIPKKIQNAIARGAVDLNDPAVTLALLQLDAVVGVKATLSDNGNSIRSMGITCALCHSTVDDSFAPGIGHRLDGWANRDLNVGLIVSLAPNLQPIADLLQTDVPTVKTVLNSWGPGRYDAWLDKDGKAFRPDGGQAGTLLPPAFGLAGVNLHTWTGSGSVPYWNAYVAATQMHGTEVTFYDPRLSDPAQYPVAARSDRGTRGASIQATPRTSWTPSTTTSSRSPRRNRRKVRSMPPRPLGATPSSSARHSVRPAMSHRSTRSRGTRSIPPPRSASTTSRQTARRRTAIGHHPLAGLWSHQKGGFYHDGRFATLDDVVNHYDAFLGLDLTNTEKRDLVQFLLSI